MVSRDVSYGPDFYMFVSIHSYNDRLLAILHAFRITFCVSSPVDSFFCGVTFGKCYLKIYNNNKKQTNKQTNKNKQKNHKETWYHDIQNIKNYIKQSYLFQTAYLRLFLERLHFISILKMLIEKKYFLVT